MNFNPLKYLFEDLGLHRASTPKVGVHLGVQMWLLGCISSPQLCMPLPLVVNPRLGSWHYMCCRQCSLHHIYANQVNNDNVHQSMEVVSSNKNIHLSTSVATKKVGDLPLNMCSTLQSNSCNSISKCVVGYYTLTFIKALKQMGI
jgi:hypothetical protein